MRLCSACLLGINCRYDRIRKPNERILSLAKKENLIPICPELLGGLPTPQIGAEIKGGDGNRVISGKASVRCEEGCYCSIIEEKQDKGRVRELD